MVWPPANLPVPQNWVDATPAATVHADAHNTIGAALDDIVAQVTGGVRVVAFPFAFDTPNLNTGVAVFTPAVGAVLLDAWVAITTAFDGTTPRLDIGTFVNKATGLFSFQLGNGVDIAAADSGDGAGDGVRTIDGALRSLSAATVATYSQLGVPDFSLPPWQAVFTATNPLKLVVSQDGTAGGAPIGGATGAGTLYLQVATP